jgi:outer membrane protein TolC
MQCALLLDTPGLLKSFPQPAAETEDAAAAVRAHFDAKLRRLLQPRSAAERGEAEAEAQETLVESIISLAEEGWGTQVGVMASTRAMARSWVMWVWLLVCIRLQR